MPSDHQPQMLDVEDAEQRQKRLEAIFERLNGEGERSSTAAPPIPTLSFDFGARGTFPVDPPTELLARVQQFLPRIERSNAELARMDPRSIDIEHIEESDGRVIEMNLGLGVFEQRGARRRSLSSSSSEPSETSSSESRSRATRDLSSTSGGTSSSSSSDSEDDEDGDGSSRSIRPLPRRANAMIEVLASRDEEDPSTGDHPVA